MKKLIVLLYLSMMLWPVLRANNVTLSNISLTDQNIASHYCNIKFDIAWDNSWRTSTAIPLNWDACWLFAKYRVSGGEWHHCNISTTSGNHTAPSGSTIAPASDGNGVFIYRSNDGNGTNTWTNAKLRWEYGTDGVFDDALVEVKLFAIEMVYVPQGSYYIGDGDGTSESSEALHEGTSNAAAQITSSLVLNIRVDNNVSDDSQLINTGIGIDGDGGLDVNNDGSIDNNEFPTGYQAFYMMKYELSQEQYAEFLNTLTRTQQMNRVETDISGTSVTNIFVMINQIGPNQNSIRCDATIPAQPIPVTFYCDDNVNGIPEECDGQTNVCTWLKWPDVAAYADWAGLRPMAELEYERAARGPNNAVYGEYAWGNTNLGTNATHTNPRCSYSSIVTTPDVNTGRAMYTFTNSNFPPRCGIFAASSVNHTRQEAGAGYYGVMELSGSLLELPVTVGNAAGRSYRAIHGNGELDISGNANTDYWPGINGNSNTSVANTIYGGTTGVTGFAGTAKRGGAAFEQSQRLRTSDRYYSATLNTVRSSTYGARFVRSAY
jgi:formylglycine-generating enzyme required for sulfatase activity